VACGCAKKEEADKNASKAEAQKSPTVARVGSTPITVADFKLSLAAVPGASRHDMTREELDRRLDEMITEEVLYQEALREKLDQDPEMRRRITQMLTQKLLDDHLKKEVWGKEVGEAEIQAYYKQHFEEFNRPEQVRVADVYIAVPLDATEQKRGELKKRAEAALAEALKTKEQRSGFGTVIATYSDSHEKYRKGDTGFFDVEGKPVGIDRQLAQAAFKIERVGSISERVIETADGYHIIMLTGKRAAVQRPLDGVRNELKQRIQREAAGKERQAYIESLKQKAGIQIQTEPFNAVLRELKSQTRAAVPAGGKVPALPVSKDAPAPFQGIKK